MSVADNPPFAIRGDKPLGPGSDDRLGFRPVAARIAASLVEHSSDNGLVVGVEGAWGSGKSSLLYLIEEQLKALEESRRPTVVNFRPWLVRDRDSLLPALFRELTVAIDSIYETRGDSTRASLTRAKDAALAVRGFAKAVGRAGELVQFAGELSALPPVTIVGKGIKTAGSIFGQDEPRSLSASKDKLVKALRNLGQSIIVTIDDVDRLEPREAFEVLRLIRSVADFPNVIYVLCYDSEILAESIQQTAGVENGHRFLEKIVQLTVTVPNPEPFQLRSWFTDGLREVGAPRTDKGLERLQEVINWDGGRRLKTPRAVIRVLDSIRFAWPALDSEGADFSDLVWLELIKNHNLALYRWIESYVSSCSVIALQVGQVDESDRQTDLKALTDADPDGFLKSLYYRHHFSDHLPGVDANFEQAAESPKIYQNVSKRDQDRAIADRRLASPDHYRLYFSLATPSHTLAFDELEAFWNALDAGQEAAGAEFLELFKKVAVGSLSKADVLLERLNAAETEGLPEARSRQLLYLFSNILDEAYDTRAFDRFWVDTIWDRAMRLAPALLEALGNHRNEAVTQMFTAGRALEWLTMVFRKEIFAHGRHGDQPKPEQEWILTDGELDAVIPIMIERYQTLTVEELSHLVDPINLLYAWQQAGDADGPQNLAQGAAQSDDALIQLLESMRSRVTTSEERYYVLGRRNLEPFLNYDEARARTEAISADDQNPALADKASKILGYFRRADRG